MKVTAKLKLICITMLFIIGLVACSKQDATNTVASNPLIANQESSSPAKPTSIFRIFDNLSNGSQVYVDVKNIVHLNDASSNISMGDVLINLDSPMQAGTNKTYQSVEQLLTVSCNQKQVVITKQWLMSGKNLSGELVMEVDKPSEIHQPTPGSEEEIIRTMLCIPDSDIVNKAFDKGQILLPKYPPIQVVSMSQHKKESHNQADTQTLNTASASVQTADNATLELLSQNMEIGENYMIVTGQVKNISNTPLKNVEAIGVFFDATKGPVNGFIKSDSSVIEYDPILPGQISPFKVYTTKNPAINQVAISFKYLMGSAIPSRDGRTK